MGLRYRKSIKLLPGVKLNISKSGISTSVGGPGNTVNFSKRGTRATVGIPGTGLSYSGMLNGKRVRKRASSAGIDAARLRVQKQYGFTDAEMKRFERKFRKNPRKYMKMPEDKLIRKIKGRASKSGFYEVDSLKRRKKVLIAILVFLAILFIASFSQK